MATGLKGCSLEKFDLPDRPVSGCRDGSSRRVQAWLLFQDWLSAWALGISLDRVVRLRTSSQEGLNHPSRLLTSFPLTARSDALRRLQTRQAGAQSIHRGKPQQAPDASLANSNATRRTMASRRHTHTRTGTRADTRKNAHRHS